MIADRDFKLIGCVVADYLELDADNVDNPEISQISGAPSGRQNQKYLAETVEEHYESMQNMVNFKFITYRILVLCNQIRSPSNQLYDIY